MTIEGVPDEVPGFATLVEFDPPNRLAYESASPAGPGSTMRVTVEFTEIDVTGNTAERARLAQVTGQRTVPQIFIGEESIGGYDELASLENRGELDSMLVE